MPKKTLRKLVASFIKKKKQRTNPLDLTLRETLEIFLSSGPPHYHIGPDVPNIINSLNADQIGDLFKQKP